MRNIKNVIILFITVVIGLTVTNAAALVDYPHFDINNIGCDSCHFIYGGQPSLLPPWTVHTPQDIDDTQYNTLCWSCHNDIDAPYVRTHSSLQTDNGYGNWTVECRVCHNPHYQKQSKIYGSASYLYSGTSTGVTTTTLTKTGAGWTVNGYQGLVVYPNVSQVKYNYKILSNTDETLTVEGPINLTKVIVGNTFAIVYGNLINETIDLSKITITPAKSGIKTVRFFKSTGANSFADGDGTYDGICEVCHTQTVFHRNNLSGDHTHNPGVNCITCHKHIEGFKGSGCDVCHGYPPVNATIGGPNGLANYNGTTGSATAGAHNLHVNTKNYPCINCHYNSVGTGSTHINSLTVTLGFSLFGGVVQGGSYDGQSGVNYNATTTSPATTVSNNGMKTCYNIYCHSTGQSTTSGNSAVPTYASPIWDTPASAVCGTCHKVTEVSGLTSGSHAAHLGTTGVNGCGDCHTGAANDASSYNSANHVNASINVSNTYTAGGAPGNGYGTCSTASCHDNGTGSLAVTPAWGSSPANCSECHAAVPGTGSHQKHVVTTQYSKALCGNCHDGAVQGTTASAQHLDTNVDVYDVTAGDLGYPQDKAKGSAYTSCTTAYCHSTGQSTTNGNSATPAYASPTWGNASSAACGTCHKVTEASGLTSGSHAAHLGATGVNGCGDCHTGAANDASSYNSSNHVNASINVSNSYTAGGTPGNGYGTCSAASCHDDGTGSLSVTPEWGTSVTDCTECHAEIPATGSHQKHVVTTSYNKAVCGDCHDNAVQGATTPAQHLDGNLDVYDTAAGDLGYPQNVAKGGAPYDTCSTAYCHSTGQSTTNGNSSTPTYATVTWGGSAACGTCHKVTETSGLTSGSHAAHLGTMGVNGCGDCHTGAANDASSYNSSNHVNASINVSNSYTAGGTPGNGYGTCSAASCHGAGAPQWGGTLTSCGDCHLGTGDVDDFTFSNGTLAIIDNAQWSWSGHGKTTSIYDVSGNSAANLPGAANGGDPCRYCHSSPVTHNTVTNPFRLANNNAFGNGWNDTCLVCHKTGSTGYDPDSAGVMTSKNAAKKIDKYHYGAKHGVSNDGGSLCWDCHDPHGDRTSGSGNIFMTHSNVTKDKTDVYGTPASTGSPAFTANSTGTDYAKSSAPFNGVCNVCHTTTAHYTSTSGDGHNSSSKCVQCHTHSGDTTVDGEAFKIGRCDSCHGYPPAIGDGKTYMTSEQEGKGVHTKHLNHLLALSGYTLDPATDQFGNNAKFNATCGVCHTNNSANHSTSATLPNTLRTITIPVSYQFGPSAPAYNGVQGTSSTVNPKTCSNVSCHFQVTPYWQNPATAGN